MLSSPGRLQPMLIDLDLDRVLSRAGIVGPELALAEADAVERLRRQARAAVGELLRIGEGAAQPLDLAGAAADVPGRADMTGRIGATHAHAGTRLKARRRAHAPPSRASISLILRPSSSVVTRPRCSRVLAMAEIQRS